MPLRPKLNKERWKPNGSAISEKGLNPQSTSTNSSVPPGAAKKNDPETVNGSSERKIQNPESINSVVPRHKVKTETIVNHNVKHAENNKTSGKFATGSQVTQGSSETPLKEKKSTNEQSPMGEPSASPSSGGDLSIGITSNSQKSKASHHQGYNLDFKELGADDVPKGHVPVLNWNYNAVIDAETSQQVFASGDKFHHVAVYKPLCIEADTGQAIRFSGKRVCGGYNRTAGWMIQYCSVLRKSLPKEILLNMKSDDETKQWLDDNRSQIRWVGGLTILQVMEKNCGNIAHFAGRILMLQHIVDNIAAYAAPPSIVENILILPTWDIMKRFLYPHNYEYWHKSVFSALVAPAKFFIGTLGNFIYRESKVSFSGLPRVQLLHNFSMTGSAEQEKKFVCFRRAVVPGFLKGRFFADDREYPSKQPSLQTSMTGAPHIPRDSLRFREKVRALYHSSPYLPQTQKEVVFLDRNGSRRVLDESSKSKVVHLFQNVSLEKGYRFKIVSFDNMPFKEQYETMTAASIAIGIHGANLVNTMFMPPLSVLFELFPFGFEHDMYINGGNSGLKYFKYQMQTGLPFNGPKQFRTVEQCIKLSHECKVHFRDSTLQVTANDLEEMERILREAVRWCDDQPAVSHHQGIS
ncbi:unnamed protein product [Chondrus crispus]|uniref:Glycosyltransferase 61 catalytic domain-containing protein n=1 Tax=Chondrus crispus TaxID=2769 RepID=R7QM17_CHOCR|nr:unnamed protein product [Chondrus crispus]CDF38828.1 unnamed protein product [Chondrus crispus]|eukprot:XP_005718733.1 unnamed protein product [Chondrus crispus]